MIDTVLVFHLKRRNQSKGEIAGAGEEMGESTGRVASRRVLSNPGGGPKMETSFEASGRMPGVEAPETGTYWSVVRLDGSLWCG